MNSNKLMIATRALGTLVFFSVLICIFWLFKPLSSPVIGDISVDSNAYKAGLRSGDQILSINNAQVSSWEFFLSQLMFYPKENLKLVVKRFGDAEIEINLPVEHRKLFLFTFVSLSGLTNKGELPILGLKTNALLSRFGVKTGFRLVKINGSSVSFFQQIDPILSYQDPNLPLNLDFVYSAEGKELVHSIALPPKSEVFTSDSLGIENPNLHVKKLKSNSVAAKIGVLPDDRVLLLQGTPVQNETKFATLRRSISTEKVINLAVVRGSSVHMLKMESGDLSLPEHIKSLSDFLGYVSYSQESSIILPSRRNPFLKATALLGLID